MTTAFVFPGQGSQTPGMGRTFYEAWPETRERFEALDAATDVDLPRCCFEAGPATLRATTTAQPCLYAVGVAACAGAVERLGAPDYVAGHSLGHLSAATAAGLLPPDPGAGLVEHRGESMAAAARRDGPGRMVAALMAERSTVEAACAGREGVSVAAFNAPRRTVISGTKAGVRDAMEAIEAETRVRFADLDVGGAFHSPVMASAEAAFAERLRDAPFRTGRIPVCSDVSGAVYTDPTVARRDLSAQLTTAVDWVGAIEALDSRGVDRYVELPPAGTLVGLIDDIVPDAETVALESPGDVGDGDG